MAVLDRSDLEASPLADLHAIAGQLGLDGYRRLRKADLIERILDRGDAKQAAAAEEPSTRRRRPSRRRRAIATESEQSAAPPAVAAESIVEGVVEVLANGSAFLRPDAGLELDGDVYISAAQVRRCELDGGDRVSGPVRPARGSERHPSLVRVDTINGEPAEAVAGRPRFDALPATFPSARLELGSEDPTLKAIEWLTPFGRGSRVAVVGAARAGKTETLMRLLAALAHREGPQASLVLAGARPEEVEEWRRAGIEPAAVATLGASPEAQGQAVERALELAKRQAAHGEHVLVAIDGLDGVPAHIARRALAAARDILDGGSLTVIATAREPFGGESTVIALDVLRTSTGRLPALDMLASGTLKPELLVGEESAAEILRVRAQAASAA